MSALEADVRRTSGLAVDLAYQVGGDPRGTPVIFLHGTSANLAVWEPVAEALTEPALTISIDQRGHGRSDQPATGYEASDFSGDIRALQEMLGHGPAVVVGHSLGARNAWVFAAEHPDAVLGVVAVDYTPFIEGEVLDTLERRVAAGDRRFADVAEIESYLAKRYPRMPQDAVARRARFGYQHDADGCLRPLASGTALASVVDGLRIDHPGAFAGVRVPMAALRGEDSAIVSPAAWAAARELRPDIEWVDVADADHYVPEEQPAVVAGVIDRMLRAVAQ